MHLVFVYFVQGIIVCPADYRFIINSCNFVHSDTTKSWHWVVWFFILSYVMIQFNFHPRLTCDWVHLGTLLGHSGHSPWRVGHLGHSYGTLGTLHDDVWDTWDTRMGHWGHYMMTCGTLGTLAWDTWDTTYRRVGHLRHSYGTLTGQYRGVTRLFHYCNRGIEIVL